MTKEIDKGIYNQRRFNKAMPVMWGLVTTFNLIGAIWHPSYLMYGLTGFSTGMLVGSFMTNQIWDLVYLYSSLVSKYRKMILDLIEKCSVKEKINSVKPKK
jgi:hypothetical protein